MLAFLAPYWQRIALYGSIVLGVLLVLLKVRDSGREAERVENQRRVIDAIQKTKEIERSIRAAPPAERKRLRDKWTKP